MNNVVKHHLNGIMALTISKIFSELQQIRGYLGPYGGAQVHTLPYSYQPVPISGAIRLQMDPRIEKIFSSRTLMYQKLFSCCESSFKNGNLGPYIINKKYYLPPSSKKEKLINYPVIFERNYPLYFPNMKIHELL